jgi:hypothetical protein
MATETRSPSPAAHHWKALGTVYVPPPIGPSHRSFGLTVGGVLVLFAAFTTWRGHSTRGEVLAVVGGLLIVTALVAPGRLAGIAKAWGRVGHALGWFNSRVLLTLMFALVLWPMGLIARLFGSDPLERRRRTSMWTAYPERLRDPKHFERLF